MKQIKILLLIVIAIFFVSCNKHTTIEDVFITKKDEYWTYYGDSGYIFFQFHNNGTYDKFENDLLLFNSHDDIVEDDRQWSVSNDSILTWRHKYELLVSTKM